MNSELFAQFFKSYYYGKKKENNFLPAGYKCLLCKSILVQNQRRGEMHLRKKHMEALLKAAEEQNARIKKKFGNLDVVGVAVPAIFRDQPQMRIASDDMYRMLQGMVGAGGEPFNESRATGTAPMEEDSVIENDSAIRPTANPITEPLVITVMGSHEALNRDSLQITRDTRYLEETNRSLVSGGRDISSYNGYLTVLPSGRTAELRDRRWLIT